MSREFCCERGEKYNAPPEEEEEQEENVQVEKVYVESVFNVMGSLVVQSEVSVAEHVGLESGVTEEIGVCEQERYEVL